MGSGCSHEEHELDEPHPCAVQVVGVCCADHVACAFHCGEMGVRIAFVALWIRLTY